MMTWCQLKTNKWGIFNRHLDPYNFIFHPLVTMNTDFYHTNTLPTCDSNTTVIIIQDTHAHNTN